MEHDIHLGRDGLGEYHVPWVDQSLYSPHGKSLIVCCSTSVFVGRIFYFIRFLVLFQLGKKETQFLCVLYEYTNA